MYSVPAIYVKILRFPEPKGSSGNVDSNPFNRTTEDRIEASSSKEEELDAADRAMQKVFSPRKSDQMPKGIRNVREGSSFCLQGYFAEVDLTQCHVLVSSNRNHPTLRPQSTGFLSSPQIIIPTQEASVGRTQCMTTTEKWAEFNHTTLAINANFFQIAGVDVHTQQWTKTDGLSLSEGVYDQAPFCGTNNQKGTAALLFRKDNTARIIENFKGTTSPSSSNEKEISVARSSSALSIEESYWNGVAGTWLVKEGQISANLGPDPDMRHARMAVGVKDGGRTLLILMFELQTAMPRPDYKLFSCQCADAGDMTILKFNQLVQSLPQAGQFPLEDFASDGPLCPISPELLEFMNRHSVDFPRGPLTKDAVICLMNKFNSRWKVMRSGRVGNEEIYLITKRQVNGVQTLEFFDISPDFVSRTRGMDVSVGVTLPELAQLMIELGIHEAVNLDGSGSSSFIYTPGGFSHTIKNQFHDGHAPDLALQPTVPGELYSLEEFLLPRPSGNHIGFFARF